MTRGTVLAAFLLWPAVAWPAESFCTAHRLPDDTADAAFQKPMRYAASTVNGKTVLQATGAIGSGESVRLSEALHRAGRVDEVWLHSPGGSAFEGTKMGRVLRRAGVLTRLRESQACVSACSIAFLGGLLRVVEPRSYYGIHMMTATRNTELMIGMMDEMAQLSRLRKSAIRQRLSADQVNALVSDAAGRTIRLIEQVSATIAADQARYLVEMSVSLDLMTEEFNQSAQGVCFLGEQGLRKFNVSNAGAQLPSLPAPAPILPAPILPAPVLPAPAPEPERPAPVVAVAPIR